MRLHRFELWTPALSEQCSNQTELQPHCSCFIIRLSSQDGLCFKHSNQTELQPHCSCFIIRLSSQGGLCFKHSNQTELQPQNISISGNKNKLKQFIKVT